MQTWSRLGHLKQVSLLNLARCPKNPVMVCDVTPVPYLGSLVWLDVLLWLAAAYLAIGSPRKACYNLQASSCISHCSPAPQVHLLAWSLSLAASCLWRRPVIKWSDSPPVCCCCKPKATPSTGFDYLWKPQELECLPKGCCCVKCLLISHASRLGWQWHLECAHKDFFCCCDSWLQQSYCTVWWWNQDSCG